MKKFTVVLWLTLFTLVCFPALLCAEEYNVNTSHVVVNQIFGGEGGYMSHNFIELYNPTKVEVDLSTWAIHYRSSPKDKKGNSDKWYMTKLEGKIPAGHSYLIRCGADSSYKESNNLARSIVSFDLEWGGGVLSITKA